MHGIRKLAPYRIAIARAALLYYLISLLWRWYSHLLPCQLASPAIGRVHYDLSFWAVRLSGLDYLFVRQPVSSAILSYGVIALCLLSLLYPKNKMVLVLFTLSYFVMSVISNIYLCHSEHYLGGMVWLSLAFWPEKDGNFEMLWEAMRYYVCWIYGSAFLWKVCNGSFFQWDAGVLTFKMNLSQYLYQNPDTWWAHLYYHFIQHPVLLNAGHKIVALAEGAFLAGFFTKKYDGLLVFSAFFIFLSIYLFSDVFFAELLIVIFPLLSARTWIWIDTKLPLLNRLL